MPRVFALAHFHIADVTEHFDQALFTDGCNYITWSDDDQSFILADNMQQALDLDAKNCELLNIDNIDDLQIRPTELVSVNAEAVKDMLADIKSQPGNWYKHSFK